jgi:eukaryotic-like serine/threonine-protein kinase
MRAFVQSAAKKLHQAKFGSAHLISPSQRRRRGRCYANAGAIVDDTLLQFGQGATDAESAADTQLALRAPATVCPRCANHFSPDGRFCPFDGEPLVAAPDWRPALDGLIGRVVDNRYEVLSVLGEGGMGIVYETRHRALGKRFALKALRKDLASDAEIAARFMQEALTAASVSHPGLVEITDFGKLPSGQPFFVMELLEGQSLATMIRRGGQVPAARAVGIIRQIAEALGAAHQRSIIHRDLKPDNIHISTADAGRDHVTIVDFGLAKVIGSSRLTRAGMVFGTPHYMSPEQAMGEATDHRADVYALGVVMYEMFTGRVPFEADSYMGVLTKHMYMTPVPPSRLPGTARLGALETILLRCLEKKPEHRYATLRDLVSELDRALDAAGEPFASSSRPRVVERSLLADELELPSREELALGLDRGASKPTRWRLYTVACALFLASIGGMLVLRSQGAAPARASALSRTLLSSAAPLSSAPALAGVSTALPTTPPLAAAAASVNIPVDARPEPAAVVVNNNAQARKATPRKAPTLAVTQAATGAPRKLLPVGGSEIVDPWSKGDGR